MKKKINISNKQKILSLLFALVIIVLSLFYDDIGNLFTSEIINNNYNDSVAFTDDFRIHFIDVGDEDAIFITQNDKTMIIDCGSDKEDASKVTNYIKNLGYEKLDYVMASHWDKDHIGGLIQLLNSKKLKVEKILYPDDNCDTNTCDDFEEIILNSSNKEIVFTNRKYKLGNADLKVLAPPKGVISEESNNNSIVLLVTYGNNKFLFMGDAEKDIENYLLDENLAEDIDLIKVGHHGSDTSSTKKIIDKVKPEYSIIMVGVDNGYEHPNESVINRLKKVSQVYRTDKNGTLTIVSNGNTINVITEK